MNKLCSLVKGYQIVTAQPVPPPQNHSIPTKTAIECYINKYIPNRNEILRSQLIEKAKESINKSKAVKLYK